MKTINRKAFFVFMISLIFLYNSVAISALYSNNLLDKSRSIIGALIHSEFYLPLATINLIIIFLFYVAFKKHIDYCKKLKKKSL